MIVFQDDGALFDPTTLKGHRGGAIAWELAKTTFFDPGDITPLIEKQSKTYTNRYLFRLEKTDTALQRAMEECSATIDLSSIGAPLGRPAVVRYDPACEAIYVDTLWIKMPSKVREVARAVREIMGNSKEEIENNPKEKLVAESITTVIEKGITVFIACKSHQRLLIESELAGMPFDRIKIFVKS
jgi:hypothetical protein